MTPGIRCPSCGLVASTVVDSRPRNSAVYRRRRCDECATRFSTMEVVVPANEPVVVHLVGGDGGQATEPLAAYQRRLTSRVAAALGETL